MCKAPGPLSKRQNIDLRPVAISDRNGAVTPIAARSKTTELSQHVHDLDATAIANVSPDATDPPLGSPIR
jgi:hypothetical protein